MSDAFVGQISMFGFNFAPRNWATCDGQLQAISQNTALFALIGTTYGGNGQTTYALPDLRGRAGVGQGQGPGLSNKDMGQVSGEASHTLISQEMPSHTHPVHYSTATTDLSPSGKYWAADTVGNLTFAATDGTPMSPAAVSQTGSSQPHENMAPYLVINFCICLFGIFPSRN